MNKFTLKELTTTLSRKEAERDLLVTEFESIKNKLSLIKQEIHQLNQSIQSYKDKEIDPVTEHAIVRYLERAKGINIDEIKAEIMELVKILYPISGEVKATVKDKKIRLIIKNKQIISVLD